MLKDTSRLGARGWGLGTTAAIFLSLPTLAFAAESPRVRFETVTDGQHVAGVVRLHIEALHGRPVTQVIFSKGGDVLATDFEPPFEYEWDTRKEPDGPVVVEASAQDADFHQGGVRLTVTVDNTPPSVTLVQPEDGLLATGTVMLEAQASDVIGMDMVRFLASGTTIGEASEPPYQFAWDTNSVPNIRYGIQAHAVDRAGNSVNSREARVRVSNFNREPKLDPIGDKTITESQPLLFTITGADPDAPRDPVRYRASNLPPWASFDEKTATFSGTPPSTETSVKHPTKVYEGIRFEMCDPQPLCDSEHITITVVYSNSAPIVEPLKEYTIKEGEALAFQVKVRDPDGDPLTCRVRRLPKWAVFAPSTCTFRGTPGFEVASLEERTVEFSEIKFEVCDQEPLCSSQVTTIKVTDVNSAPVWDPIPDQEAGEEQRLEIDLRATDADGDVPNLRAEVLPDGAKLLDNGDGTGRITWRPRADQSGRYEVLVSATDPDHNALITVSIRINERVLAISGVILDDQREEPVPGALVRLVSKGTTVQETTTDKNGFYIFTRLKPGTYVVKPDYTVEKSFLAKAAKAETPVFRPQTQRVELISTDYRGLDFLFGFD